MLYDLLVDGMKLTVYWLARESLKLEILACIKMAFDYFCDRQNNVPELIGTVLNSRNDPCYIDVIKVGN